MIRHQAIELLFDPATEATLTALWNDVVDNGLPSPLLRWKMRPHVTLVIGGDTPAGLRNTVERFARTTAPFDVSLDSVGAFGGGAGVVFLAPVVTRELLDVHARADGMFADHFGEVDPRYRPGRWVPHSTVAVGLDERQLIGVFGLCAEESFPIRGRFESVGIHEVVLDPDLEGWARIVASSYRGVVPLSGAATAAT